MIINSVIKTQIYTVIDRQLSNYSEYERIATDILFYKYILNFIKENPEQSNNISDIISAYSSNFITSFIKLKNNYTSYLKIINFLTNLEPKSFIGMKEVDIDYVYKLYLDGIQINEFDPDIFEPSVYGVNNLTSEEFNYLKNIHFNIMAHIYRYYIKFYNLPNNALKIVDANSNQLNIGKKILFKIDGIKPSRIYADILANKFPISNKYYKVNYKYPYIEIINL